MLRSAVEHYQRQQRITASTLLAARRQWRRLRFAGLDGSFGALLPDLLKVVLAGQVLAARDAAEYVPVALEEQGLDPDGPEVAVAALAGVASDGRPLASLLYSPVTRAKAAIDAGADERQAMATAASAFDMIVATQLQDVARVAAGVALAGRPQVGGYVRMLNPPSCSRCAILAGKFFRWNAGFDRHPKCDCRHVPVQNERYARAEGLISDPREYFDGLSEVQQDRIFTKAGARAIRDGADMGQVVNVRRGARGLSPAGARITEAERRMLIGGRDRGRLEATRVYGQDLYITSEGVTRRGLAGKRLIESTGYIRGTGRYGTARVPRLMPESIYQIAGDDRDEAIRLLRRFGYVI